MVTSDAVSEKDIDKLIIPDDLPNEPVFKAYIEAMVYDREGHIIQYHKQPMRSLTQYFLALMSIPIIGTYQNASTNNAPSILVNVLGLPSQQSTYIAANPSYNGANIVWDWTIQVGSGTQAFSPTLNSLAAPIANGSGAGQLTYDSVIISSSGTSISTTITVINYTSDAINVTEIGLVGTIYVQYQNSSNAYATVTQTFLLSYDTFSTVISIPAGSPAAFKITISFAG
jgi:hypothetical protein